MKKKIIMIDCLWYKPESILIYLFKIIQFSIMNLSISKYVVWASHELKDYSKTFKIPIKKIIYIPHHHTLEGYVYKILDGNYIFSGGDGDRDYFTLIKAVKDINIRVFIATRRKDVLNNKKLPKNIIAFPTTNENFRKIMAASKMVIVPMEKNLLHSGGQQTYLNAMAMGKPVIVADDKGASDYINNGQNGFVINSGDVNQLKATINLLLNNNKLSTDISLNAKDTYIKFSTGSCLSKILNLAKEL